MGSLRERSTMLGRVTLNLPEIYDSLTKRGYHPQKDGLAKHKTLWIKNYHRIRRNLMIYVVEHNFSEHEHSLPTRDPGVHFEVRIYMGDTRPAVEVNLYGLGWDIAELWKTVDQAEEIIFKLVDLFPEETSQLGDEDGN